MKHDDLIQRINTTFSEFVAGLATFETVNLSATKVQYDNMNLDPPATLWIRFQVQTSQPTKRSFGRPGDNRFRTTGQLLISIITPGGQGTRLADHVARQIQDAYGKTVDGIVYRAAAPSAGRRIGSEWHIVVTVPFQSDFFA